jgi:hypothetical protein
MGINSISTKNVNGHELRFGSGFGFCQVGSSFNGLVERAERVCIGSRINPRSVSWPSGPCAGMVGCAGRLGLGQVSSPRPKEK